MDERNQLAALAASIVYVLILAAAFGGLLAVGGTSTGCTPTVDFTYSASALQVKVTDRTTCLLGSPVTFTWAWGDGSQDGHGFTAQHNYTAAGSYVITHTAATNQGSGKVSKTVVVYPSGGPVTASFTWTNPLGSNIASFSGSGGGGTPPYGFSWNFGDGTPANTEQTPSHGYVSPGTYQVVLTVTDHAAASATATRAVTVQTGISFTPSFSYTVSALKVSVSGSCTGCSSPAYSWAFGDGGTASGRTASHTYLASGDYSIVLTVTDYGITEQVSHNVQVSPPLVASFTWTAQYLVVSFVGSATGGIGTYTWSWNFGDSKGTSASQSPSYTYGAGGAFQVGLIVTDNAGHTGSASRAVTVSATSTSGPLSVGFTVQASNLTVSFTSNATGGSAPYTYTWTFGDSSASTDANPVHAYAAAGNYSVTLSVRDSLGNTKTATEKVSVSSTTTLTCPDGTTGTYPDCTAPPAPLSLGLVFLAIGLVALLIALYAGLLDASLEDREKWILGLAVFAAGTFLLIQAGLALPYVPKPF